MASEFPKNGSFSIALLAVRNSSASLDEAAVLIVFIDRCMARGQAHGKPLDAKIRATQCDLDNGKFIGQHGDFEFTFVQIGDCIVDLSKSAAS